MAISHHEGARSRTKEGFKPPMRDRLGEKAEKAAEGG
jgi:hypothetical protein